MLSIINSIIKNKTALSSTDIERAKENRVYRVAATNTISHLTRFNPEENPFSETLKIYYKKSRQEARDFLLNYYLENQPKNMAEALEIHREPLTTLHSMSTVLPWSFKSATEKFARVAHDIGAQKPISKEAVNLGLNPDQDFGWQFFGPVSNGLLDAELDRLIAVFESIRSSGYKPNKFGHIHGYALISESDWRIVNLGGKHRYASLLALGYREIEIELRSKAAPHVIKRSEAERWHQVENGFFTMDEALKIFDSHFH